MQQSRIRCRDRGDTIIEVVLAFAIFSFIAVGVSMLMDKGLALAQRSLEITLVRQQIDAQADLIRYAQDTRNPGSGTIWKEITSNKTNSPQALAQETCPTAPPPNAFIMHATKTGIQRVPIDVANFSTAEVYSRVGQGGETAFDKAYGMWVQAVEVGGSPKAYDMHIKACWNSLGSSMPVTIGTIVRLYDQKI